MCVIGTGNILDFTAQQIGGADMSYYERTRSLASFQNNPSIGLDPFSNVRFQGGMRALVGFAEGGIGAGLYMTPTFGVGQFVGSMMMAHGYDNFQSGARQAYRGSYKEPTTIPILQSFGLSHKNAQIGHEFITTMGVVVGGLQVSINSANANAVSRLPTISPPAEEAELLQFTRSNVGCDRVANIESMLNSYLGEGTRLIRNKASDPIFVSRDSLRRVRFDFIRPNPHRNPHMHVEEYINGGWNDSGQIYPIDVPHN